MGNNCRAGLILALAALSLPISAVAGEARYKKNTVVDFEGATVEGKSRKPYSAYVSEKALNGTEDLTSWKPDFIGKLQTSRKKWEYSR